MKRRSFVTAVAGLPIVGLGATMRRQQKPTARVGITVQGPELITIKSSHRRIGVFLSLRFANVPPWKSSELVGRITPLLGDVNGSPWRWQGGVEPARSLMFTNWGVSDSNDEACNVVCAFTPAKDWSKPWPGSHRPIDFETEILKALRK